MKQLAFSVAIIIFPITLFISGNKTEKAPDNELELSKKISQNISLDLGAKAKTIEELFKKKIESFDLVNVREALSNGTELLEKLLNQSDISELPNEIRYVAKGLELELNPVMDSTNLQLYQQKLETVQVKFREKSDSSKWLEPLRETYQFLKDSLRWFDFLQSIFKEFSKYEFQKNRKLYNVVNLDNWGKGETKGDGIKITSSNFLKFTALMKKKYQLAFDKKSTEERLKQLNKVLEFTVKNVAKVDCDKSTNTSKITSFYILFSDYISDKGYLKNPCDFEPRVLNLVALEIVFIDQDFTSNVKNLAIIAQQWNVIGKRKTNVVGLTGADPPKQSEYEEDLGKDGQAGGPGGPGGGYFGISDRIFVKPQLTVTMMGGKGGKGQSGTIGKIGANGTSVTSNPNCFYPETSKLESSCNGFSNSTVYSCQITVVGGKGEKGGRGGAGGKAGVGGLPGQVNIIVLKGGDDISIFRKVGELGDKGVGGLGGQGGMNGGNATITCHSTFGTWSLVSFYEWNYNTRGPDGDMGPDGYAGQPPPAEEPENVSDYGALFDFKILLVNNLDSFNVDSLINFYISLGKSEKVESVENGYTVISLTDELSHMIQKMGQLRKIKSRLLRSYIKRITKRINKSKEMKSDDLRVLRLLFMEAQSLLNEHTWDEVNTDIIIDLKDRLIDLKDDIQEFNKLQEKVIKTEVIKKQRDNFDKEIKTKVKEAKGFVDSEIMPAIDAEQKKIDDEVKGLLNEIEEDKKNEQANIKKLEEKRERLKKAMMMTAVFGSIQMMGTVMSFVFPVAGAAASLVGSMGMAAIPDETNSNDITVPRAVLATINTLQGNLAKQFEEDRKKLSQLVDDTSKAMASISDFDSSKMTERLRAIQAELLTVSVDRPARLNTLKTQIRSLLASETAEAKKDQNTNAQKFERKMKVLNHVVNIIDTIDFGLNIYNAYKNKESQFDEVKNSIQGAKEKIKGLDAHRESVEKTMMPMLHDMLNDMKNTSASLEGKSQAFLDITKWQIQTFLKDSRIEITRFTSGFAVENSLSRSIERVEDAMVTLVSLFDRIQDFQSQAHMANFIADIANSAGNNNQILDPNLAAAVTSLQLSVKAKLIVANRDLAVRAFNQWTFPFARYYLEDLAELNIPKPLHDIAETDLTSLANEAKRQIELLIKKMEKYQTTVEEPDSFMFVKEFTSDGSSKYPFYVWKNQEFVKDIADLLSGKKVYLVSDILRADLSMEAVKMSSLGLRLKTISSSEQAALDNILNNFNITLGHAGNNYYHFDGKIYIIPTKKLEIFYSFEKGSENVAYQKIKNGDFLLSPYTMWEATLCHEGKYFSFKDLAAYKDKVNLELCGIGKFVKRKGQLTNLKVESDFKFAYVVPAIPRT